MALVLWSKSAFSYDNRNLSGNKKKKIQKSLQIFVIVTTLLNAETEARHMFSNTPGSAVLTKATSLGFSGRHYISKLDSVIN